jgi:DNA-binding XRE family transcriptional regulator
MSRFPPEPLRPLLIMARALLGHSQKSLGEWLHSSRRTAWRWEKGKSIPTDSQLAELAAAVYPKNRALAARIAAYNHETLESLGIEKPPAPPSPSPEAPPTPAGPVVTRPMLVELIVATAADVLGAAPSSARPALKAAFERAVLLGLTAQEVAEELRA